MDVKDLIASWRTHNAELRQLNVDLDHAREAFNTVDAEHASVVAEWDAEKAAIQLLYDQNQQKWQQLEANTQKLQQHLAQESAKVELRVEKNNSHQGVLDARKQSLEEAIKKVEAQEVGIKARLEEFRLARDRSRGQLQAAIQKLQSALPVEKMQSENKIQELRSAIERVHATTEQEQQQWEAEVERRRKERRFNDRKMLAEEMLSAGRSKSEWAELAKMVPPCLDGEVKNELAEINARIRSVG